MDQGPPPDPGLIFSAFDFSRRETIVVAVSGGSDSLAALLLLNEHLHRSASATKLVAVTVDHGLRNESAQEAAWVQALCATRGIEHRTKKWVGEKPKMGLSAAARDARYRLLAEAAREAGSDIIVTGHTADDQAETVFMRRERGTGPGLAGMAPLTLLDGSIWLARPLLQARRSWLREYLSRQGIAWIDDPTNANVAYERVRARVALADKPNEFDTLISVANRSAAERAALAERAARIVKATAKQAEPGLLHIDPGFLSDKDRPAAVFAMRHLLALAGGAEFPPPEEAVAELLKQASAGPVRTTLAGALIATRKDGIWIARESRDLPQPQPAASGMIWDGRYRIELAPNLKGAAIAPAGKAATVLDESAAGKTWPKSLLRAARAAQPVVQTAGDEDMRRAMRLLGAYRRFLPSFDLPLARALAELVGAEPVPEPPFASHNGKEG